MSKHTPVVSTTPDVGRLAESIGRAGIDPTDWVTQAEVVQLGVDDEGVFVDVTLIPSGEEETARVGALYAGAGFGLYVPLEAGDEVILVLPQGDPDYGWLVVARTWCKPCPPPPDAISDPTSLILHAKKDANVKILTTGKGNVHVETSDEATTTIKTGKAIVDSPDVSIGDAEGKLLPISGILNGEALDPYTGAKHFALGNASTVVKAKKG